MPCQQLARYSFLTQEFPPLEPLKAPNELQKKHTQTYTYEIR